MEPEPSTFPDGATLILEWTSDYAEDVEDIPRHLRSTSGRLALPTPDGIAERLDVSASPRPAQRDPRP